MNGRAAYGSAAARAGYLSAYAALVLLPLAAAMTGDGWTDLDRYGRLVAALVLLFWPVLSLQPVLAARLKPLDRQFGLDGIYVFHKTMGMTAAFLQAGVLAFSLADPSQAVAGAVWAAAALVAVLGASAFLYREMGLTYETWRRLHNVLFIAVLAAALLQTRTVAVRLDSIPLTAVIVLQTVLAVSAYGYHRVLGPAARRRRLFRVRSVEQEAGNVWTLVFEPPEGQRRFDFLPGQFQFITFDSGRGEEHPFTIASSPTDARSHASTIKGSGDFTRTIGSVRPGDRVAIQAAFGRFSHAMESDAAGMVFIAGGIGITPFMSMLRTMRDRSEDRDVLLFYASRSEADIVFRGELERIASGTAPRLRVVHVVSAPGKEWQGESGRIDRAMIERHVPDRSGKIFYLCGPPAMMTALTVLLLDAGVPQRRIRSERFAL